MTLMEQQDLRLAKPEKPTPKITQPLLAVCRWREAHLWMSRCTHPASGAEVAARTRCAGPL